MSVMGPQRDCIGIRRMPGWGPFKGEYVPLRDIRSPSILGLRNVLRNFSLPHIQ